MKAANGRYDPETILLLEECLDFAWQTAVRVNPVLKASEAERLHTRRVLASALLEIASTGERNRTELIEFSLRALPSYRNARPDRLAG